RHTRFSRDWSSDVCSSDLAAAAAIPWRVLMLFASALAVCGGGIVIALVGDGPYVASSAPFDPAAIARVFADRGTRLATLGYLGRSEERRVGREGRCGGGPA